MISSGGADSIFFSFLFLSLYFSCCTRDRVCVRVCVCVRSFHFHFHFNPIVCFICCFAIVIITNIIILFLIIGYIYVDMFILTMICSIKQVFVAVVKI